MAEIDQHLAMIVSMSTKDGQAVQNTWHFRVNPTAGEPDIARLQALADMTDSAALLTAIKAVIPTDGSLDAITVRQVHDPLAPTDDKLEATHAYNAAGTKTAQANVAPDSACALIKLSGDRAGRNFRGRFFAFPVQARDEISGNFFIAGSSGYTTPLQSLCDQLAKTAYPSGGSHFSGSWNDCDLEVYSRKLRSADEDPFWARVNAIQLTRNVRWLRSRTPTR